MQKNTTLSIFIGTSMRTTLLALASSSAYAAVDYAWLDAPVTVNEIVNVDDAQQLTEQFSFSSETSFVNALDNNLFDDAGIYQFAQQTGADPYAAATFNIVGGHVTLTTDPGSSSIQMSSSVPQFNQTFNGTTRDQSSQLLKKWIDTNAGVLQPGFVSGTNPSAPSLLNPISGAGPASPVSFIPASDMSIDINGGLSSNFLTRSASEKDSSSVATRFSNYCTNQKCAQFYSIPISYTKELGNEWAVLFKLPLTFIDTAGVSSYSIALSSGLRIPVSRYLNMGRFKWDVIPLVSVGGVGSDQAATQTSLVYSGGIQSNFGFAIGSGYSLVVQNQYNHFITDSAARFITNNQRLNNDIINDVYRNGLQLAKNFDYQLLGRTLIASIFFVDTRFSGDALAIDNQQEFGFDIGLKAITGAASADFAVSDVVSADKITKKIKSEVAANDIKIGISYMRAKNIDDAVSANLGWSF